MSLFNKAKSKSFDKIMGTFVQAELDLSDYIEETEAKRDEAGAEAQRQVEIANAHCDEIERANRAKFRLNRLLGE